MKKTLSVFISFIMLLSATYLRADEGMWLLSLLQQTSMQKMKKMGLEITAEDIYSVNQSSLKDAIVALDRGGCTAELISPNGLLLTNHHCGYGEIQEHSSVEHDYLKNGFWASSYEEELSNPGKTATFLVRMEEVTDRVNEALSDSLSEMARKQKISEISEQIKNEAVEGTNHEGYVRSFFKGNRFFLFITKTYKDVRLVAAPPSSIGKFGGDTDNWEYPRHTGDFALFRIYAGPDGEPAEYSPENEPLETSHLKISLNGYEEGDFAMVMGSPGSTSRYLPSWGVKQRMETENKVRIKVREKKLNIMDKAMNKSDTIRIQYASKYSRSSNYYKYSIGQNRQLKNLDVIEQKQALEEELFKWIAEKPSRQEKYGETLPMLKTAFNNLDNYERFRNYFYEAVVRGPEVLLFAYRTYDILDKLQNNDEEGLQEVIKNHRERGKDFFKDYHQPLDKEIFVALLNIYREEVGDKYSPTVFETIKKQYNNSIEAYADSLYDASIFVSEKRFMNFLDNPGTEALRNDLAFRMISSFIGLNSVHYQMNRSQMMNKSKGMRQLMQALQKMKADRHFYPDANSTMRLTYGTVESYTPKDAVRYDYYTTLKGVMQKKDPNDKEFHVPIGLEWLYEDKEYGRYADKNGEMRVCFITNNDITGGNSGSPVLNGKGHLIGVAFDGNWEAMSGDIEFVPSLQRCINVDVRYVLFVIDKYAGAERLIDEMDIVQ